MGESDPFTEEESASDNSADVLENSTGDVIEMPESVDDAFEDLPDVAGEIISSVVGSHALLFGVAIGTFIGLTGEAQGLAAAFAAILAGERLKLRLSDKVKMKLLKEPGMGIAGVLSGYLVALYLIQPYA